MCLLQPPSGMGPPHPPARQTRSASADTEFAGIRAVFAGGAAMEVAFNEQLVTAIAEQTAALIWPHIASPTTGFLDVEGAATFLSCPRSRIYALCSANRLPHHRDGSRLLFDPDELRAYVLAGGARRP
jgi:excisionase family DNA binding protein